MATAAFEIAELERSLAPDGEDIILRRVVGAVNQANIDVECRAHVRQPTANELVAGFTQDELICILSPTEITRANWPGGQLASVVGNDDPRIPSKNRGDKAFVRGRWRSVQHGRGFYPGGSLVRIEMRVLG